MIADPRQSSIAALNAADPACAAAMIAPFIERSPCIAARVARHRPFAGTAALLDGIRAEIRALDRDGTIALLRAHPELAPARPETMTPASIGEQSRLGLAAPREGVAARLRDLNARYRERFGFPFIVAVHRHASLDGVLADFEARIKNAPDVELDAAVSEIFHVVESRIVTAFAVEPTP